jgi:hypothetical protein
MAITDCLLRDSQACPLDLSSRLDFTEPHLQFHETQLSRTHASMSWPGPIVIKAFETPKEWAR